MKNASAFTMVIAGLLLTVMAGIVIHAPMSVYVGTQLPEYNLWIKAWKEILMLIASLLLVVEVTRCRHWQYFLCDRLLQVIFTYVGLHVILSIVSLQPLAAMIAGFAVDLRYVAFFVLLYVLLKLCPLYQKQFVLAGVVGALIVMTFALLQTFVLPADILRHIGYSKDTIAPYLTVDENQRYVRINSTLRGPNPLGAYAVIVLGVATAYLVRCKAAIAVSRRLQTVISILLLGGAVAIWTSYSRSALLALLVSIGMLVVVCARMIPRIVWVAAGSCVAVVGITVGIFWNTTFVQQVVLHEDPNEGNSINSNDGHLSSVQTGFNRMLAEPFGSGVGSTGSASLFGDMPIVIENQYLFVAHEVGWLGLIFFMIIFIYVMRLLFVRRADWLALGLFVSGVGLAVIGLLLPVWVDDTVSIIWWGLAAVVCSGSRDLVAYKKRRYATS